jgi:hypothetical protein
VRAAVDPRAAHEVVAGAEQGHHGARRRAHAAREHERRLGASSSASRSCTAAALGVLP